MILLLKLQVLFEVKGFIHQLDEMERDKMERGFEMNCPWVECGKK